ncbi:MAG: response regulator transcription factor [Chloroflexi bacterium]|nr:response regulator transcription factor [Chloroflexota bacterium]
MPAKTKKQTAKPKSASRAKSRPSQPKITVAILEDNQPLTVGLRLELDKPDIQICSTSDEPEKFLLDIKKYHPSIAIIDLRIWSDREAGFNTIEKIREISPDTNCIIYTFIDDLQNFHRGINLGIKAFVSKNIKEAPMEQVLRIVAGGGTYYGELLKQYLEKMKETPSPAANPDTLPAPTAAHLSDRELEILRLFGEGKTEDEIAETLTLSIHTVKSHTNNIRGKVGVKTTLEAVRYARLHGLL